MRAMWKSVLLPFCLVVSAFAAEKLSAPQLIELAKSGSPQQLREAIEATFDSKSLQEGTAWAGHGPDFFFAIEASSQPYLFIDGQARGNGNSTMDHLRGSNLWYTAEHI